MANTLKSLDQISTNYSIFEKDQVLTHDQLNSVAQFFDNQSRLTRMLLLGVGIVCGLKVSRSKTGVTVTKGVAITTEGDLLFYHTDRVFDRFTVYDESHPTYQPLLVEGKPVPTYELFPQGAKDSRAIPLTQFQAQTTIDLNKMVAVLFMENYEKDDDLCSGTDCDNLGKDCLHTIKLLLVESSVAKLLLPTIPTHEGAARTLAPIAADRPTLPATVPSMTVLRGTYVSACQSIQQKLTSQLTLAYKGLGFFLQDLFPSNPVPFWGSRLSSIVKGMGSGESPVQYVYDFLKDVVDTYNQFLEQFSGDSTLCCPHAEWFPKHVVLGLLGTGTQTSGPRTGLYPSPLTSHTVDHLKHALFLAQKIDTLIRTFKVNSATTTPIRITPSHGEDHQLEERAIPFYYQITSAHPIHLHWNYKLHQRGLDLENYSYHASSFGAKGAAADPLRFQIGKFSFFRIEGHIGKRVTDVVNALQKQIREHRLPFGIQSILLGTNDRKKITIKPPIRYTDLNRFHYVLRQDVFHQLDEVKNFSVGYTSKITQAVKDNLITDPPEDGSSIPQNEVVTKRHEKVVQQADLIRSSLGQNYSSYKTDTSWKTNMNSALETMSNFKANYGKITRTEFTTPFDSIIGSTHTQWLDWLDIIIKNKEDLEDDKLLFQSFTQQHPGIEHGGGVVPGGTFILVYDTSNRVLADFMLPYFCCEVVEEEAPEPTLPKAPIRPPAIIDGGIKILPPREKYVVDQINNKFTTFESGIQTTFQNQFDGYKNSVKESFSLLGSTLGKTASPASGIETRWNYADELLGLKGMEAETKRKQISKYEELANNATLPSSERASYATKAKAAENELVLIMEDTTKYMSDTKTNVALGSEGYQVLQEISLGVNAIKDTEALNAAKTKMATVLKTTKNTGLSAGLNPILLRK